MGLENVLLVGRCNMLDVGGSGTALCIIHHNETDADVRRVRRDTWLATYEIAPSDTQGVERQSEELKLKKFCGAWVCQSE